MKCKLNNTSVHTRRGARALFCYYDGGELKREPICGPMGAVVEKLDTKQEKGDCGAKTFKVFTMRLIARRLEKKKKDIEDLMSTICHFKAM
eukprot:13993241-Ditylum_brightwellii.AAC.1